MNYARDLLIGRWYRNDTNEQGIRTVEYAELLADGSFEFTFVCSDSASKHQEQIIELGDWGLVGDIHFTITKNEVVEQEVFAADLNNADNYQAYKVLQLTHDVFKYQHVVSKEEFTMYKVVDEVGHC
ncbi:hypothetical protein [Litorilituus sediminis]|uniref:Lipocalin-like domain-containing protein n=1 Tax=Litorilituus sediminis TaxID=718192 RepID=A0A4P6P7F9_9GAMM|nr:hypothetical protein [Litorilituus sediminis]QBG37474.1 hypothetical protein EMK97_17895 [Litorilituus sediminis]